MDLVTTLLNAPVPVIATIALKGDGFINEVKHCTGVRLYELKERNRDALLPDIAGLVRSFHL